MQLSLCQTTFEKAKIFFVLDFTGDDSSNWNFAGDVKGIFRPQSFSRSECNHDTSWLPWQSGKGCSEFDPLNKIIDYQFIEN